MPAQELPTPGAYRYERLACLVALTALTTVSGPDKMKLGDGFGLQKVEKSLYLRRMHRPKQRIVVH
eukprot:9460378-Pyramimonas_sp.AAC.1